MIAPTQGTVERPANPPSARLIGSAPVTFEQIEAAYIRWDIALFNHWPLEAEEAGKQFDELAESYLGQNTEVSRGAKTR
jgi:hypothetical protein